MTQPHYIDREAIDRLVAALEPLALLAEPEMVNMGDPLSKWFTIAQLYAAKDALSFASNRRPDPMEAVAWREKVVKAYVDGFRSSGEGWNGEWPFEEEPDDGERFSSIIKAAHDYADRAVQALAVIPETNNEG